nr:hypothetical protein [Nesterenkonia sp. Act20]
MSRSVPTRTNSSVQGRLSGTGVLLRFMLRQDRLRLSLWVLGIGLMSFYVANAVQAIVSDEDELVQMAGVFTDPVGRLMTGPAYGMAEPSFERFYAAGYVLFIYLLIALMSIFIVVRHTRGEEASGRAELLRASVLGRHATLAAAVSLAFLSNVCAALLVLLGALSGGFAVTGSLLVASSGAAVGLFFTAVGAVSAQLTEASRTASAAAGSVLGLSYLIRMGGDAAAIGGTRLSWFSPLGWSQQTAPYVQDRWWPLLLPALLAVAALLWAFFLSTRRDLGAGLLPSRPGPASARPSLGTPLGISRESLRGGLRGWGLALVLCGAMFGGYAQTMVDSADDLPEQFQRVFTGESLMLGYLAYISIFLAIFVAAAGVSAVQQIRGEESQGRAALMLTAPMSRGSWLLAHVMVLLLGLALILLLVGLATGGAAASVLHQARAQHFADLLLASLHQGPAVLAVLGLVVAVFGWAPRFTGAIGWVVLGYAAIMTNFGRLLDLPPVMQNFNVFSHLSQYPVEPVTWAPVLVLSLLGVAGLTLGVIGWQRREVTSG